MADDEQEWRRLMALIGALEGSVARALLDAIRGARQSMPLSELISLITRGDAESVIQLATQGLNLGSVLDVVEDGTRALGRALSVLEVRFEGYNRRVVEHFGRVKLEIGKSFTDAAREGIRQVLRSGFLNNENPPELARRIRRLTGLTPQQAQAVENYRRALENRLPNALERALRDRRFDRTVEAALRGQKTLSPEYIDKLVSRYEERYLRFHTEEIARTQSMEALSFVQHESWNRAVEAGAVAEPDLIRRWYTAEDERVCPVCAPIPGMNPDGRGLNEPFATPKGPLMRPLAHNQCRCVVFTRPRLARAA